MLTEIEFLDPENPRLLPLRLRRLFGRTIRSYGISFTSRYF